MLIDYPIALVAGCTVSAALLNLAMLKLSPQIKDVTRHLAAGAAPVVGSLGALIGTNDSVVAYGPDLLALGASVIGGLAAASSSTRFVRPQAKLPRA